MAAATAAENAAPPSRSGTGAAAGEAGAVGQAARSMQPAWWAASVHTLPCRCAAGIDQPSAGAAAAGAAAAVSRSADLAKPRGDTLRVRLGRLGRQGPAGAQEGDSEGAAVGGGNTFWGAPPSRAGFAGVQRLSCTLPACPASKAAWGAVWGSWEAMAVSLLASEGDWGPAAGWKGSLVARKGGRRGRKQRRQLVGRLSARVAALRPLCRPCPRICHGGGRLLRLGRLVTPVAVRLGRVEAGARPARPRRGRLACRRSSRSGQARRAATSARCSFSRKLVYSVYIC